MAEPTVVFTIGYLHSRALWQSIGRLSACITDRGALTTLAYTPASQAAIYDEALEASVRRFQRSVGLRADGIAGKETLIALTRRLDGAAAPGLGGEG